MPIGDEARRVLDTDQSAGYVRMIASTKDDLLSRSFFIPMPQIPLTPFSYFDLLDACALQGCPVCRLETRVVRNYLDSMLYENVNDPGTQDALCRSRGLCREHAWLLTDIGSSPALGIAILYRRVAREVDEELKQIQPASSTTSVRQRSKKPLGNRIAAVAERIAGRLKPRHSCPACAQRDKMIDFALRAMLEALGTGDERMRNALRESHGICRPHLMRAFLLARGETSVQSMQLLAREKLEQLIHDLDEFIRKNDYRFQDEGFGKEGDSWRRVLAWMTGEK
jgi:hypothetical protein